MKLLRKLRIPLFVLGLLIVIGVVATIFAIDMIAKAAVQSAGTAALGVPTNVGSIRLSFAGQSARINELKVSNPQPFEKAHFLLLKKGELAINAGSLADDLVEIPRVELDGVDIHLEKRGDKANFDVVLDNLRKTQEKYGGPSEPVDGKPEGKGKRFVVRELVIRDVTAHVSMTPLGDIGKPVTLNVAVAEVKLKDVGSDSDRGLLLDDLVGQVTQAVLAAVIKEGAGKLPREIAGPIAGTLNDLGEFGVSLAGEAAKQAGEAAGKAVGDVTRGIGDLFNKKDEKKK